MAGSKHGMDSLNTPTDTNKLSDGFYNKGKMNNRYMDSIAPPDTSALKELDKALSAQSKEEEKKPVDAMSLRPIYGKSEKKNGVKIGSKYVSKAKLVRTIVIFSILIVFFVFFLPPIATNDFDKSGSKQENIFATMGLSELKEDILKNKSMYNEEALSTVKAENYRVCNIVVNFNNTTPFEVKIPNYEVVKVAKEYKDKVVCAGTVKEKGDIIPPFSNEAVEVELIVNVSGMTDQDFDDCVTSVVLKTVGMKKKVGLSVYCPCIPAFVFVSDASSYTLEGK